MGVGYLAHEVASDCDLALEVKEEGLSLEVESHAIAFDGWAHCRVVLLVDKVHDELYLALAFLNDVDHIQAFQVRPALHLAHHGSWRSFYLGLRLVCLIRGGSGNRFG